MHAYLKIQGNHNIDALHSSVRFVTVINVVSVAGFLNFLKISIFV